MPIFISHKHKAKMDNTLKNQKEKLEKDIKTLVWNFIKETREVPIVSIESEQYKEASTGEMQIPLLEVTVYITGS